MPTELQRGYFAGIIDGEGCFNIHRNTNRCSFTARLMIGMNSKSVLDLFVKEYGGSVHLTKRSNPNHNDSWMYYSTGRSFRRVYSDVIDLLIVKREAALVCMELQKETEQHSHFVKGIKGTQRVSPESLAYRLSLKLRLNTLNKTGKKEPINA